MIARVPRPHLPFIRVNVDLQFELREGVGGGSDSKTYPKREPLMTGVNSRLDISTWTSYHPSTPQMSWAILATF